MLNKFQESEIGKKIIDDDFYIEMIKNIKLYKYECVNKNLNEYEIDKILGKHIISHLQDFFNKSRKNKTLRNRAKHIFKRNKTIRKT